MSKAIEIKYDKDRLDFLKKVVNEGQAVFFIVGIALAEIKTKELYKFDGHENFNDFCEEEWGWTKRYCNQLIVDASVVKGLPVEMRKLVTTENAARELAKLPAILRPPVVAAASAGGTKPVTAAAVKSASPPPLKKSAVPPPKAKKSPPVATTDVIRDGTGLEVPQGVMALWSRIHEVNELIMYCKAIRLKIQNYHESKDPLFSNLNRAGTYQAVTSALWQVESDIKNCKPFAVCPSCKGKLMESCSMCGQTGIISEHLWDTAVLPEDKAMREKVKVQVSYERSGK